MFNIDHMDKRLNNSGCPTKKRSDAYRSRLSTKSENKKQSSSGRLMVFIT
jgi:hypothetical protein